MLQPFASPEKTPGQDRRLRLRNVPPPEKPAPGQGKDTARHQENNPLRVKIVKPKLNVRNQLSRFVASYLETVRLTGPTGVW